MHTAAVLVSVLLGSVHVSTYTTTADSSPKKCENCTKNIAIIPYLRDCKDCPKDMVLIVDGKRKCKQCPETKAAAVTADGDPHVSVRLVRSKLDRPVCYDLPGKAGEHLRLYDVGKSLHIYGQLVASPRHRTKDYKYFGRFILITKDFIIEIDPTSVEITPREGDTHQVKPWTPWVSRANPVFFSDGSLEIVHWKRKIIRVNYNGTRFEIKRNLLKYGSEKRDFFYLGIYLEKEDGNTTYGGIIGESLNAFAVHKIIGTHHELIVGNPSDRQTTVVVTKQRRYDYIRGHHFSCWMVPDVSVMLRRPFEAYKLSRATTLP